MTTAPFTFTLDLEDHRIEQASPPRYPAVVRTLMDLLAEHDARATVFVVGTLARRSPELVRELSQRGHEIGYHSHDHVLLTREKPERFGRESADDKHFIEDLTGRAVRGFRAPVFSMTGDSLWTLDTLLELGFDYSSSVLPARNPLHGFAAAPRQPFRWPNGLLELPAPVAYVGPWLLPFLGGFYLRYLPDFVIDRCVRDSGTRQSLWTYCHPYDFDVSEPFTRIKGASLPVSLLLWFNRRSTMPGLRRLLERHAAPKWLPFAEQIDAGAYDAAAVWQPA